MLFKEEIWMSTHEQSSALKVHKLTFWEATMIVVGANIGSGILGLAYSSRKAGWPVLLLWLIVAGIFTTFSMLYVAETTLRTEKPLQLPDWPSVMSANWEPCSSSSPWRPTRLAA